MSAAREYIALRQALLRERLLAEGRDAFGPRPITFARRHPWLTVASAALAGWTAEKALRPTGRGLLSTSLVLLTGMTRSFAVTLAATVLDTARGRPR